MSKPKATSKKRAHDLCGKCGKLDRVDGERGGICLCGADFWVELEDFSDPDLEDHIQDASKNLNLSPEEMKRLVVEGK